MFATMDSRKILFALICVAFSAFLFSMISCDSDVEALRAALVRAEQRAQKAEAELARVKAELAKGIPRSTQKRITELEKLVEKAPQATIRDVQFEEKKKNMDITVKFDIKNRKGIEGSVNIYFFHRDGTPLVNKNGPISISKEFTPKRVAETLTVKLSVSYDKLTVKQAYNLKFTVRIHDKPTNDFLEKESYSKPFYFDPFKD